MKITLINLFLKLFILLLFFLYFLQFAQNKEFKVNRLLAFPLPFFNVMLALFKLFFNFILFILVYVVYQVQKLSFYTLLMRIY